MFRVLGMYNFGFWFKLKKERKYFHKRLVVAILIKKRASAWWCSVRRVVEFLNQGYKIG